MIGKLEQVVHFANHMVMEGPRLQEFFDVLDTVPTVRDRPDAVDPGRMRGLIEFKDVSYSYDGKRAAVADLTFTALPGETVALVGATGAGKSTALALLHRAFDPQSGAVKIDGMDIRGLTLSGLRRNIGVVFQEVLLFNRSVAENLRVGKPDATEEEMRSACERAQVIDVIDRNPEGFETVAGERGRMFSGGERQRLSIARALLKDPPILILDEATSALDALTEAKVQAALAEVMKNRTTFVIAHRLATIRNATRILVFQGGRIVETGSFDELMRLGGSVRRARPDPVHGRRRRQGTDRATQRPAGGNVERLPGPLLEDVGGRARPPGKRPDSDLLEGASPMNERLGVGVAILSSAAGAAAAVATRYLITSADPFTLAALRFGGGVICLLPLALLLRVRWPGRGDWPAVAGLGFMFFAVFFVFYNVALAYTTVARGTLALSTLPLMTMVVGALLGIEALSARKTAGVLLAMIGVAAALASGLRDAPPGAWRGDLIMAGATLCMALYNVWSRPFIQRSSALGFLTAGMGVGATALVVDQRVFGRPGAREQVRAGPVAGRPLSRGRRRRAGVLPVGLCACNTPAPRASPTR